MRLRAQPDNLLERIALLGNDAPAALLDTQVALLSARAIMAGTKLGVFSALLKGPLTAAEIATGCGLNERATVALLGALTASGYLRYGKGTYGLTPQSRKWLAPKDSWSLYDYMPHLDDVWQMASHLEGFLRDGVALDIHASSTEREWERYQRAMRALAAICAREIVRRLPVRLGAKRMLDIGGAHGFFAVELCRKHSGMCAIILDLEDAIKKAAPILALEGMGDRVQHRVGDALSDDLGIELYDLILISNLAHHFTNQQNRALVRRAAQALVSGGILVILEPIRPRSANAGDQPAQVLNLFFALTSASGTWSIEEIQSWHRAANLTVSAPVFLRSMPGFAQVNGVKR
jgi:2-polyprenyl-3-methyl-5-hydroxy-6-metoxy-1,4-benzoquinol methylase